MDRYDELVQKLWAYVDLHDDERLEQYLLKECNVAPRKKKVQFNLTLTACVWGEVEVPLDPDDDYSDIAQEIAEQLRPDIEIDVPRIWVTLDDGSFKIDLNVDDVELEVENWEVQ